MKDRRKPSPVMLVHTEDMLAAKTAVGRQGVDATLSALESREPVLMHYLMEQWDDVYKQLRRQPQVPSLCRGQRRRMRQVLVVAVAAHASALCRLWQQTSAGMRLAELDLRLTPPAEVKGRSKRDRRA